MYMSVYLLSNNNKKMMQAKQNYITKISNVNIKNT